MKMALKQVMAMPVSLTKWKVGGVVKTLSWSDWDEGYSVRYTGL